MIGAPKEWSIAIYAGASLDALASQRAGDLPALTFRDVDDLPARFVADPFLVRHEGEWLLFFEVLNAAREKGEVALARSPDAVHWRYDGTILREPFHLSYPNVFAAGDDWLMTPEALEAGGILLYRAEDFPRRWTLDCVLLEGTWADPTVFEHGGAWWMFACPTPYQHDRLELFRGDDVRGPWHRHPRSPIVAGDPQRARPAGRPRMVDGALVRFAQDCRPDYGNAVRAFAITVLTADEYAEEELAGAVVGASGAGWNADGMHTVDLHAWDGRWIAAVDGYRYGRKPECAVVTDLDALRDEWDELLARSRAHSVFGSYSWMRAACNPGFGTAGVPPAARPASRRPGGGDVPLGPQSPAGETPAGQPAGRRRSPGLPHVVTLRVDGRLEAILPLVRADEGIEFATPLSDYNDFIASSRLYAARAFHWLMRALPSGTRVVLRGLREDSDALTIARAAHATVEHETDCFHAEAQKRSLRKSVVRAQRAAAKAGLEVTRLQPDDDVAGIFLALNRARFGANSRFYGANETFVREALPPLLKSGAIAAFALVRGRDVLAIDLALVDGDTIATWNGGFTAEAARFSPSRLLFAAEIAEAGRFDLLRGLHPYKRAWATGTHALWRAEVIA